MKDWFKARNVWGAAIATLTDDEAGRLMKAIWAYTMNGEQVELAGAERGIFALILLQLSQDDERESDISAKRAMAGSKGGKQTQANQANATFATEEEANQANATNKNKNKSKNKNKEQDIEKEQEEEMFARFWNCYPRHEAKQNALKAFQKIHPNADLLNTICAAVEKWKKTDQWTHDGGQYIPHPATWLNQRRWEDDIPSPAPQGQVKRVQEQAYEQRPNDEHLMSDTPTWFREYRNQLSVGE